MNSPELQNNTETSKDKNAASFCLSMHVEFISKKKLKITWVGVQVESAVFEN